MIQFNEIMRISLTSIPHLGSIPNANQAVAAALR